MATVNGTQVRDVAARRRAAIQASEVAAAKRPQYQAPAAKKPGLLDALTNKVKEYAGKSTLGVPATSGPMSADAKAIKTRVEAEQQLGDEVGGKKEQAVSDRLRRLDALFAEKVLGKEVSSDMVTGEPLVMFPDQPDGGVRLGLQLLRYTRSLDAAWAGLPTQFVVSFHHRGDMFKCYHDNATMTQLVEGEAPHPAEALVLACLRAVGVEEKELV